MLAWLARSTHGYTARQGARTIPFSLSGSDSRPPVRDARGRARRSRLGLDRCGYRCPYGRAVEISPARDSSGLTVLVCRSRMIWKLIRSPMSAWATGRSRGEGSRARRQVGPGVRRPAASRPARPARSVFARLPGWTQRLASPWNFQHSGGLRPPLLNVASRESLRKRPEQPASRSASPDRPSGLLQARAASVRRWSAERWSRCPYSETGACSESRW
jgi:hypothetical protein